MLGKALPRHELGDCLRKGVVGHKCGAFK
jgi:hypothetical protein